MSEIRFQRWYQRDLSRLTGLTHMFCCLTINAESREQFHGIVRDWCAEQFGPVKVRWDAESPFYYFRDENDAMAFRMRWC